MFTLTTTPLEDDRRRKHAAANLRLPPIMNGPMLKTMAKKLMSDWTQKYNPHSPRSELVDLAQAVTFLVE